MKKYFALMMAGALLSMLSCSKENKVESYEDINFNITVCNPNDGPATKALKSGWVAGDVLNIWFNTHVDYTPNLTLTYNGSTWTASKVSTDILDELGTDGSLKVIWEGNNNFTGTFNPVTDGSNTRFNTISSVPVSRVLCNGQVGYTYDAGTKTLTASINELVDYASVQITVPGLPAGDWSIKSAFMEPLTAIEVRNGSELYKYSGSADTYILGQAGADGHVFVAGNIVYSYKSGAHDISFTLTNGTNTYVYGAGSKTLVYSRGSAYSFPLVTIKLPTFDGEDSTPAHWIKQ